MVKYLVNINQEGKIVCGTKVEYENDLPKYDKDFYIYEVTEEVYNNQYKYKLNKNDEFVEYAPIIIPEFTSIEQINNKVVEMIRNKYSVNEESKMLRLGIINNSDQEFINYNDYIEECRLWGQNKKTELGLISE